MRSEFANVAAGFDKLPGTLTPNAVVVINAGGTAMTATTTPNLGTPSAGVLTNCTGYTVSSLSGLGSGVSTALAINVGSAGSIVTNGGALGTPSSGTLTSCTGLPISTGVSGLGTGVATALAINIGIAGAPVTNGGVLGTPSSGTLTNCTSLPVSTGISGFGTGVATALAVNVGTAGAIVTNGGALGTPASGTLTNCTGLPVSTGISGFGAGVATFLATPSSANLLAALTTKTGTGNNVFDTSPTFGGTVTFPGGATWASTGIAGLAKVAATADLSLFAASGSNIIFGNGVTEFMRLASGGSLLVNTTAPGGFGGNAQFAVQVAGPNTYAGSFYNSGASTGALQVRVDNTACNLMTFNFAGSGSGVGTITTNGTTTSYNTSSDQRLKQNITDAADAGAIIDALRVRQWNWKSNGSHEAFGFVAQEEAAVYAAAVTVGDSDPDTIDHMWSRDDSKLVPLLIKEAQSLRARVAALEAGMH